MPEAVNTFTLLAKEGPVFLQQGYACRQRSAWSDNFVRITIGCHDNQGMVIHSVMYSRYFEGILVLNVCSDYFDGITGYLQFF